MSERLARVWFGATALLAFAGVAADLIMIIWYPDRHFTSAAGRVTNQLFYFTIESNLIVAVTTLLLAIRLTRSSPLFHVFRLSGLVGIVITGLVYHAVLAGLVRLTGGWVITNLLLHTVVPVLAVVGWLLFGPRRPASWRLAALSLAYPALWLGITLIRGPLVGWYPYPFVNVDRFGYPRVLLNALAIAGLFLVIVAVLRSVDGWLHRRAGDGVRVSGGSVPAAACADDLAAGRQKPVVTSDGPV
jgi:hypothetical protein